MTAFAEKLARRGFRVIRFDFPYMMRAREIGKRCLPDKQAVLVQAWQNMIRSVDAEKLLSAENR